MLACRITECFGVHCLAPSAGPAGSHLQETPGFGYSHSIRPEGEARHHSNAVFFTSFRPVSENVKARLRELYLYELG